jgi:hypothetical protein
MIVAMNAKNDSPHIADTQQNVYFPNTDILW